MSRQQFLLGFVALLLLVKFGFGSLNDARAESRELLDTKRSRYIKGKNLLETESALDSKLGAINQSLEKAKDYYPIADTAQNARLNVQRRLNTLADQNNLVVESAEWLSIEEGQPERAIYDIRYSGDFDSMANFHLALEQLGAWISVKEINANVRRQKVRQKNLGTVRGSMLFDVFYIVDEQ